MTDFCVEALAQNANHWQNLKRKPTQSGLCLKCFQDACAKKTDQSFVTHYDLSKCD